MNSKLEKKLRLYNILISFLIIGTLQLDFFIAKSFMMESTFNLSVSLLLLINILRQTIDRIYSTKFIAYIINSSIILTGLYCFSFLLILKWGFGFEGRETPYDWILAFILNLLLGIVLIIEIIGNKKLNNG